MSTETNTVIVGWNRAIVGRENVAAELFASTVAYWERLQRAGTITSWEPMFLEAHGGDLNGMFILRGNATKLDSLRHEGEFIDLILRAQHCLENVGVIGAWSGMPVIQDMMGRWTKQIPR